MKRRWGDNLTATRYTIIAIALSFGLGLSLGVLI